MRSLRSGVRIPLELPVNIRWKSSKGSYRKAQGKTGTISGNGLFITIPVRLPRQTSMTLTITLPPEVTKVPIELRCQGRVVRWIPAGGASGFGAIIDDYKLRTIQ